MDAVLAFITAFTGSLLRIGLPLVVTALLVWGLRRLDARWEAEGERLHVVAVQAAAGWHCWEVHGCPPERRENCPAYRHPEIPCWQHFRAGNGDLRDNCLICDVFLDAPVPVAAPAHFS